jgi:SAM-dependent methyltransferase
MFIRKFGTFDFVKEHSHYIFGNVLDIGGGSEKYKKLLASIPRVRSYKVLDICSLPHVDIVADAADTGLSDASVDSVVCTQVLEHVQNPDKVAAEIGRVLSPGGMLLVTAPFMIGYHPCPKDYYRFTVEGMSTLFAPWFEVERIDTFGGIGMILYTSSLLARDYAYDTYLRGGGIIDASPLLSLSQRIKRKAFALFCEALDILTPENIYSNVGCVFRRK